ncbi:phage major tail protein, TP901-1 family [Bacillus sp. XF8]|uniref:phage major tail protein, TP901-1 family n=1 Tax=Bacillus sp. XF8 TaxID=2819289 RepID=UPI001AA05F29|nr:phage major tail protein, TP901-1 family [Bacillus sp. XF8]MBO1583124.1 phage major tail protein, TP901-1 family [Bacillus sp. XF8]
MAELKNKMMRGDDFLIAAVIKNETEQETLVRPFDQTDSSHSVEADEIEAASKDRTISDYGKVTETRSFEGIMAEGDPFPAAALKKLRSKEYIEIYEINKRTKKAEKGIYMITSFEKTASTGEFATYSLEVKLSGSVTEETLTTIPPGAGETVTPPAG